MKNQMFPYSPYKKRIILGLQWLCAIAMMIDLYFMLTDEAHVIGLAFQFLAFAGLYCLTIKTTNTKPNQHR